MFFCQRTAAFHTLFKTTIYLVQCKCMRGPMVLCRGFIGNMVLMMESGVWSMLGTLALMLWLNG
jgi:hypothetical protein